MPLHDNNNEKYQLCHLLGYFNTPPPPTTLERDFCPVWAWAKTYRNLLLQYFSKRISQNPGFREGTTWVQRVADKGILYDVVVIYIDLLLYLYQAVNIRWYLRRQAMYVYRNNEACSWNHCCSRRTKSITYSFVCVRALMRTRARVDGGGLARACDCGDVALIIQHATRRHIVICCLSVSTTFFDIISWMEWFSEKKNLTNIKCVLSFFTNFILKISHLEKNSASYCHTCKTSHKVFVILVGF